MKKVQDLNEDEVNRIRQAIEAEGDVEGDLRKDISMHIKRLIEIGSYRGYRIAPTCRSADSARTPMRVPAKARAKARSRTRRRQRRKRSISAVSTQHSAKEAVLAKG